MGIHPFNALRKLDSIKSRLQTTKQRVSIPRLALTVYQEEGFIGFYRGIWIPLMTISFVRACICISCPASSPHVVLPTGAASFTIYSRTKEYFRDRHWLSRDRIFDISAVGGIRFESTFTSSPESDTRCVLAVVPSLVP